MAGTEAVIPAVGKAAPPAPAYGAVLLDNSQTVAHFHDDPEASTLDRHGDPYAPAPAASAGGR